VAVQLGIPFKLYDFETEYRQKVVDYMIAEYRAGRTPNPDIMCNQEIKFRLFLDTALADGADMIATGHYAKVVRQSGRCELHRAKDDNKDQTYFLYRVTEAALSHTLFPLGELTKPEVRQLAAGFGLATAAKKESMGICFVGKVGIKEFLSQYAKTEPGAIIDQTGHEIGRHDGAIFYTIGQRQGLGVGGGLPYYVVGKDMARNEVYVTTDLGDGRLWTKELKLTSMQWINGEPQSAEKMTVRTRHRAPLVGVEEAAPESHGTYRLVLRDEVRAITPGQSAVLYAGDCVLGGGIVV
jgi:tRNA-specific 2-thiouridylase